MPRRVREKPEDFKKRMQQSGEAKERAKDNMYLTGGEAKSGRSYRRSPELMKEDAERRVRKRRMLSGGQAKLDKNKNNRLDAQDFKILRAEKAKGRGMGLQDEKVKPGKVMKAKRGSGLDLPVIKSVKPEAKKNPSKTNPNKKRFSSMEEMRKAKGFKPGETPAEFNKRKAMLRRSVEAAKATRLGKIIAPIALAGVGAVQYLKSKMKKEESMRDRKKQPLKMKDKMEKKMGGGMMKYSEGGGATTSNKPQRLLKRFTPEESKKMMEDPKRKERLKKLMEAEKRKMAGRQSKPGPSNGSNIGDSILFKKGDKFMVIPKKMGGGMMQRPMGYKKGSPENPMKEERFQRTRQAAIAKVIGKENVGDPRKVERPSKKMGGGMMNKPMGYRSGKSVKVKCKLGRNKPTKMY
jgi:hypothetical protein